MTLDDLARMVVAHQGGRGGPRHIPRAALHAMAATVGRLRPDSADKREPHSRSDQSDMTFPAGVDGVRSRFPGLPCTSPQEALDRFHASDGHTDRI